LNPLSDPCPFEKHASITQLVASFCLIKSAQNTLSRWISRSNKVFNQGEQERERSKSGGVQAVAVMPKFGQERAAAGWVLLL
jgi:hypothetical protein